MLDMGDELVRRGAGADPADTPMPTPLQFADDDLGLIGVRVGDGGECGRANDLANATMQIVLAGELAPKPTRSHFDDGHQVRGMEDYAARVAVDRREVREPFDVPAQPIIVIL